MFLRRQRWSLLALGALVGFIFLIVWLVRKDRADASKRKAARLAREAKNPERPHEPRPDPKPVMAVNVNRGQEPTRGCDKCGTVYNPKERQSNPFFCSEWCAAQVGEATKKRWMLIPKILLIGFVVIPFFVVVAVIGIIAVVVAAGA